jgi:hypothetical protein
MTKKEIKSAINKAVYQYAESLGYDMSDDNDGSYVTFSKPDRTDAYDCIDYSRSEHETCVVNWTNDQIKADAELIDVFANEQKAMYDK